MRRPELIGRRAFDLACAHLIHRDRRKCAVDPRMAMSERLLDNGMIFTMIIVDRGVRFACRGRSRRMGLGTLRGQAECEKRAKKYRAHQDSRLGYESCIAQKMPFSF